MTPERIAHLRELSRTNPVPSLLAFRECLDEIERLQQASVSSQYHELLNAVQRKWIGETTHQTALRYIREAEANATCLEAQACDVKP